MENFCDGPFAKAASSRTPTSRLPPATSFLGFHERLLLRDASTPGNSSQNPFVETHSDQTLESAFARLSVWPYDENGALYSGFGADLGNRSGLKNSLNNGFGGAGEGYLPRSLRGILQTDSGLRRIGLNNFDTGDSGYLGLQDYDWRGLDTERWDIFEPESNQYGEFPTTSSTNRNRSFADFSWDSRGVINGLACKKSNGKRPHLLWESLNCLSVKDLRGKILYLAKDERGGRLLQRKMEGATTEEINTIFMEVIDHVDELMMNEFGNFVVQKLVVVCSEEQRTRILLMVTKTNFKLFDICLDMHGTRAVQKLLEHLTTQDQIYIFMFALSHGAVTLSKDKNGHHVIQHCLKHFSGEDTKYLLNEVADNCFGLATNRTGCVVLQQCVEFSRGELRERLAAGIIANALLLAEDHFGNYVVQHLLGLRIPRITANVLRQFEGSYFFLSRHKYGSNVVEKCLVESGEEQSAHIIMELLRSPNSSMLLVDPFGNYVIQSALSVSQGLFHSALLKLVGENSPMMRSNPYGKKVLDWINRRKLHI